MSILDENNLLRQLSTTVLRMRAFASKQFFEPLGLTLPCALIMHLIKVRGSMQPSELMKCLGSTKSNISQRISMLKKQGLIRETDEAPADKRSITLVLTEKGNEVHEKFERIVKTKHEALERILTEKEKSLCFKIIEKINSILDKEEISICNKKCPTAR